MPQLKVIRASAGSGKTFTLTGAYLRLLFAETDYFEHILAVTFTNRATNEMKERIVRELDRLSRNLPSGQLDGIMKATGLGERQVRLKAAIILKKGMEMSEEEVKEFCRGKIANYKVPKYVKFVEGYPMTASGKIQKFKLRDMAIKELHLEESE